MDRAALFVARLTATVEPILDNVLYYFSRFLAYPALLQIMKGDV